MRIRSRLDGVVLNAELRWPAEDTNYGNLMLMADSGRGKFSINMVEAQRDYELLSASPVELTHLEEAGYYLAPAGRMEVQG
jgi:hypothetical protein